LNPDLELIEGLPTKVREARERVGLDHVALGHRIGEKVSTLQKIEAGKFSPDMTLVRKLEHELKVKLLVPPQSIEYTGGVSSQPQELTLGDVISIKKKDQRSG